MAINALRYVAPLRPVATFDVGPALDRFRQGTADGDRMRVRNAMLKSGSMMAAGDIAGARDHLFDAGEFDAGIGLEKYGDQRADRAHMLRRRPIEEGRADAEYAYNLKRRSVLDGRADAEHAYKLKRRAAVDSRADDDAERERIARAGSLYASLAQMAAGDPERLARLAEVARQTGFEIPAELQVPGGADVAAALAGRVPSEAAPVLKEVDGTLVRIGEGGRGPAEVVYNAPKTPTAPAPPSGYRYKEDGTLEAIPGGPATKVAGSDAGKIAAAETAMSDLKWAKGRLGQMGLASWDRFDLAANRGEIGKAERAVLAAINAVLRMQSGAAVTQAEVDNMMNLYGPQMTDKPETIVTKLTALEDFLEASRASYMQGRGPASPTAMAVPEGAPEGPVDPATLTNEQLLDAIQ